MWWDQRASARSRVAREAAALAAGRGVEVFWAFCESHAREVPFHVVTRLLRAGTGITDLDGDAARARVREQLPDADAQDLLLLDDLLGIADPDVPLAPNRPGCAAAPVDRTDQHRIAGAHRTGAVHHRGRALGRRGQRVDDRPTSCPSIPRTSTMVLITARPEYEGVLTRVHGAQTIALAPLADSDTAALIGELLGSDPSVGELAAIIADRAAGNPFFAEEIVRELVQRGVLTGEHGGYVCRADVAEVSVPATVQAAIEARIDRLTSPAKQTLNAASVIGARFGARAARRAGHRSGGRRTTRRRADRSGAVHPDRRIRLQPPADPRGGLRVAAEIRSRRIASPARRGNRIGQPGIC